MHETQSRLDLNLLIALDALLDEESVTAAALRLHLSGPAMSRTLARIRRALDDPILVRSGRVMVPTPYAREIRPDVHDVVERAGMIFRRRATLDLATLERTFTLLADDTLLTTIGSELLDRVRREAPGVALRMLPEGADDSRALRDGIADLEIGVIDDPAPETRVEPLLTDDNVGVARAGHPLLDGRVTPERYAAAEHITASRRGILHGPIDDGLAALGLRRRVVASTPTFSAALLVITGTDLVGRTGRRQHGPLIDRLGLRTFEIPLDLPRLRISQAWHPRNAADPAHEWLRGRVREIANELESGTGGGADRR